MGSTDHFEYNRARASLNVTGRRLAGAGITSFVSSLVELRILN